MFSLCFSRGEREKKVRSIFRRPSKGASCRVFIEKKIRCAENLCLVSGCRVEQDYGCFCVFLRHKSDQILLREWEKRLTALK